MHSSRAACPLPDGWTAGDTVEDLIQIDGVQIQRAGVSAIAPDGEEICGAAASVAGGATARARFELLERVSVVEAMRRARDTYESLDERGEPRRVVQRRDLFPESDSPQRWNYSRSNGVAIHRDWPSACRRAAWELLERDRVLRAWQGGLVPARIEDIALTCATSGLSTHEWMAYDFPEHGLPNRSSEVAVVGVFGFPKSDEAPFVLGLAARPQPRHALEAAVEEALQLLAFLWGEPAPEAIATAVVATATQHLDCYQVRGAHETVRRWLAGGHSPYHASAGARRSTTVQFVDLTPSWMPDGMRVAKALCADVVPLAFGESPWMANLPQALRIHPIP